MTERSADREINDASLSDCHYETLEGRLTGKGIRLLAGGIEDTMIEV